MAEVIVNYCGLELEVEYTTHGEYRQPTLLDPPEAPEVELLRVVSVEVVDQRRVLLDLEDEIMEALSDQS